MTQKSKLTPSIPITSKYFKYVPACATDIRETFERVRSERVGVEGAKASKAQEARDDEFVEKMFDFIPPKVTP